MGVSKGKVCTHAPIRRHRETVPVQQPSHIVGGRTEANDHVAVVQAVRLLQTLLQAGPLERIGGGAVRALMLFEDLAQRGVGLDVL